MKYVVINCWEREIYKVGEADTLNEATEIMKADFMKVFADNFSSDEEAESAFNDGDGKHDEWNYDYDTKVAWLNNSRGNYDWVIIEVGN